MIARTYKDLAISWAALILWSVLTIFVCLAGARGPLFFVFAGLGGWLAGYFAISEGPRSGIPVYVVLLIMLVKAVALWFSGLSTAYVVDSLCDYLGFLGGHIAATCWTRK